MQNLGLRVYGFRVRLWGVQGFCWGLGFRVKRIRDAGHATSITAHQLVEG